MESSLQLLESGSETTTLVSLTSNIGKGLCLRLVSGMPWALKMMPESLCHLLSSLGSKSWRCGGDHLKKKENGGKQENLRKG